MLFKTLLYVVFVVSSVLAQSLHEQVLYTQVRLRTPKAGGSGTVIWSEKATNGFFSTYILTCHHVIDDAIRIETKWDPILGRERKHELRSPVQVEFFNWKGVPHGKPPLTSGAVAEIAAYDARHDMALVQVHLSQRPTVARLLDPKRIPTIVVGTPVMAVGCALGHDPILTSGIVTHQGDVIDYADYWMSNAQVIFGNSGGGMFAKLDDGYWFIGVPSRVAVIGWASPITHMGYFSPISRVYKFLEEQIFDFIIPGSTRTEAECEKIRKEKRATDEKRAVLVTVSQEQQEP